MLSTKAQSVGHSAAMNWLGLAFSLMLILMCFLFALPAILSGNLLFSTDHISRRPAQVILYNNGQSYTFEPGEPEYDQLVNAAYDTLAHENGINEMGWSDKRFEQARLQGKALEMIYTDPVKLPGSRIDIADPTRLFIPLNVVGHEGEVVFRGSVDDYWAAPIRVDTLDRVRSAANVIIREQK
jgi:hypothetical protein